MRKRHGEIAASDVLLYETLTDESERKVKTTTKEKPRASSALSDAEEWAAGCPPARAGRPCATCRNGSVAEYVSAVAAMVRAGKSQATEVALHARLREKFGYALTVQALRNHRLNCLGMRCWGPE